MTARMKQFASDVLAQKIGYLKLEYFADRWPFAALPTMQCGSGKVIAPKDQLLLVVEGTVEIHPPSYGRLVKELAASALFGELALLRQSLYGTRAISGTSGATAAVMGVETAKVWIQADPTVTSVLSVMRCQRLVATAHKWLTILNKLALLALSQL